MNRTVLTIIGIIVVLFLISLSLWNIRQGRVVKEIGMPGGGSVKFGEKTERAPSVEIPVEKKPNSGIISSKKTGGTAKISVKGKVTNRTESSGVHIEQHTEGNQSPAINTGQDATVNYGKQ